MSQRILSMGEAVVDVLPSGDLWRPAAGGSSYNVALALGRLAAPVAFVGRLSRDAQGQRMCDALARNGVALDLCARDDRASPLSLVSAGTETTSARYSIYLEGTAHAPPDLPPNWLDGAAHLHVSSFSAIAGDRGAAVESAMNKAHGRVSVSLDINVRPTLVPPRPIALSLIEKRLAHVDLVKASDEDLRWLRPDRSETEVAAAWAERFGALVILTQGERGATAYFRGEAIQRAAFPVDVADTVGAGDAFVAAILACAVRGEKPRLADVDRSALEGWLDFASAAAALCCSRHGADSGARPEIEALLSSFGRRLACI